MRHSVKETVTCPKCNGEGFIKAFGHIANGVCFCCAGRKTIKINRSDRIAKLSADTRNKAEWVLKATADDFTLLDYSKLLKIRTFCGGGWGISAAYPLLHDHWNSVGESVFQARQEEVLAAN